MFDYSDCVLDSVLGVEHRSDEQDSKGPCSVAVFGYITLIPTFTSETIKYIPLR